MDALTVQKIHANELDAFAEVGAAPLELSSQLQSQLALSSRTPFRDLLLEPTFDISSLRSLPKVSVLYFNADADAELVRFAAERSAGIVIAGAGAGEFSQSWATAIANVVGEANVPVVVSSRINRGSVVPEQLLVPGTIAAYNLPPAKAAVLLRLSLTITNDPVAIQNFFECHPGALR
jgi:L-asparaginase